MNSEADGFLPTWDSRDEEIERAKLAAAIAPGDVKGISDFLSGLNCETICD